MNNHGQIGTGYHLIVHIQYSSRNILVIHQTNYLLQCRFLLVITIHCGIFEDMNTYCWGYNQYGQLGSGDQTRQNRPIQIQSPENQDFTDLSLGTSHTCGIIENGSVYCWGLNNYGQRWEMGPQPII